MDDQRIPAPAAEPDYGAIAVGTPVLGQDGSTHPIEAATSIACAGPDGVIGAGQGSARARGRTMEPVVRIELANGRGLVSTAHQQVRTDRGWTPVSALAERDRVLCPAHLGVPGRLGRAELARCHVAGYLNAAGGLGRGDDPGTLRTAARADAEDLAADLRALGVETSVRAAGDGEGFEVGGYGEPARGHSTPLPALARLTPLLAPTTGAVRRWDELTRALLALPSAGRAAYLSAFASVPEVAPPPHENWLPNLLIRQRSEAAIDSVAAVLRSLELPVTISRAGGERWVAHLLGGEEEQIRFIEVIGFSRSAVTRIAAARCLGRAWARTAAARRQAETGAEVPVPAGGRMASGWSASDVVTASTGLGRTTAVYVAYRLTRPSPRYARAVIEPSLGECAWAEVVSVTDAGRAATCALASDRSCAAYVAGGIVVRSPGEGA